MTFSNILQVCVELRQSTEILFNEARSWKKDITMINKVIHVSRHRK